MTWTRDPLITNQDALPTELSWIIIILFMRVKVTELYAEKRHRSKSGATANRQPAK